MGGQLIQVPYGTAMVTRIAPGLGPEYYKTYSASAPLRTHWRAASCAEYECPEYLNGFRSVIDESAELGQKQGYYIRHDKTRRFTIERLPGGLTAFTFEAGQAGFGHQHKIKAGRPELLVVRGGDFRGNPRAEHRIHTRPEDWADDFRNHQDRLNTAIRRG